MVPSKNRCTPSFAYVRLGFFLSYLISNELDIIDYRDHIVINPDVRFGKPCIVGTRITVYDVLSWMASGMSVADILKDYPELKRVQIQACLAYAADKEHKVRAAS